MKFSPPSLEEIRLHAAKIGLTEIEADKFWNYYGSNGWKVGRNPMISWHHAIMGWKLRWQACQQHSPSPANSTSIIAAQNELTRVESKLKEIRDGVPYHCNLKGDDLEKTRKLRIRKQQLLNQLGWTV